jgi:hypothetical protein
MDWDMQVVPEDEDAALYRTARWPQASGVAQLGLPSGIAHVRLCDNVAKALGRSARW